MASGQVDRAISIGHVFLQFNDSIKQALQDILTSVELSYVLGVRNRAPKIDLAVIVLC
jgi:hypothetical protein